jgi:hypothetical protein
VREALAAAGADAGPAAGGTAGVGPAAGGMAAPYGLMTADAAARTAVLRERGPFKPAQVETFKAGPGDIEVFADIVQTCSKGASSWRPLSLLRGATTAITRN